MALSLKCPILLFPILAPPPENHRPSTEVRFSRWNNANAEKFEDRRRAQKEIEDDIRLQRRFNSATRITNIHETATANNETFKSIGTPSSPSSPSIPGKKSKYSKNPNPNPNPSSSDSHPAFRQIHRATNPVQVNANANANVTIADDGVSYIIDGAPFEFKYSYTETPKAKPIKLREPPYVPFGPTTRPRPWTGRAPLPPSKKKLKEFDSFKLPPPHKKGVKPVQAPGPFLAGSGPPSRYVKAKSREEILGEPLSKEEINDLVNRCMKTSRQLNIGRDGLTHNMLDNIHAHWKRRRVCKIKCKGVCTVDMDNVRHQLEERTWGKVISCRGGVIYLFRGRYYNYRTRPRFPLMLWKPIPPVYPRLIQRVPEGLTLEEATEMRKKGRKLIPICKLGKNGVYCDLVKNVREAFEECELVRINCQGVNGSDYRRIGAKLKDLVPCVLISFEHEHILMWRGRNWKSSLPKLDNDHEEAQISNVNDATSVELPLEGQEVSAISLKDASLKTIETSVSPMDTVDVGVEASEENVKPSVGADEASDVRNTYKSETLSDITGCSEDGPQPRRNGCCNSETMLVSTDVDDNSEPMSNKSGSDAILDKAYKGLQTITMGYGINAGTLGINGSRVEAILVDPTTHDKLLDVSEEADLNKPASLSAPCIAGVLLLQKQAVENGSAVILDGSSLDADVIYQTAVTFARSAPPGPVFRHRPRKVAVQKLKEVVGQETGDLKVMNNIRDPSGKKSENKSSNVKRHNDFDELYQDVVPQGSLRVDELAKLLA
ncbi:hypothetical protein ACB094_01G173500 [Castanea mollissima]